MKKRFKRLGAMLLAGTMLLGATACGGGSNSSTTGNAAKSEDSASTTETGGTTSSGDIDTSEHVVMDSLYRKLMISSLRSITSTKYIPTIQNRSLMVNIRELRRRSLQRCSQH